MFRAFALAPRLLVGRGYLPLSPPFSHRPKGHVMKLLVATALIGALTLGASLASAETIDLSTWTCSKFQGSDKDTIGVVLAWLDGYYQDENAPAIIDTEKFVANAKKIGEYCSSHPTEGLITATDKLFGN
jgi:acid stress chaperone HdeB